MDAITSETILPQQATDWNSVFADVNAWRGSCIHQFSMVEVAVTETLLALSMVSSSGAKVGLRHLIGQRLEDLSASIGPAGPFEDAGKIARGDLLRYREQHEAFRNLLCHGVVKVSVQRSGKWVLVIEVLSFHAGVAERKTFALDQGQALARLEAIKRDGQRLSSTLGQLRKIVAE